MSIQEKIAPVHPGEILLADVLEPLGLSRKRFASLLGVSAGRINAIVRGRRAISADTAVRLGKCLGASPAFWLGLQTEYDLQVAKDALGNRIDKEVTVLHPSKAA